MAALLLVGTLANRLRNTTELPPSAAAVNSNFPVLWHHVTRTFFPGAHASLHPPGCRLVLRQPTLRFLSGLFASTIGEGSVAGPRPYAAGKVTQGAHSIHNLGHEQRGRSGGLQAGDYVSGIQWSLASERASSEAGLLFFQHCEVQTVCPCRLRSCELRVLAYFAPAGTTSHGLRTDCSARCLQYCGWPGLDLPVRSRHVGLALLALGHLPPLSVLTSS